MIDLESIYVTVLRECAPEILVRRCIRDDLPKNVAAIGKCAGKLMSALDPVRALCCVPRGYPPPPRNATAVFGGHPDIDDDSFHAGEELVRFVESCEDVLFLISGGGSACVEMPLPPFTRDEVMRVNKALVDAGLPIGAINTVRKHLSAIKGGRLGARVRGRCVTLVYSDVATRALADVASGPTIADATSNGDAAHILASIGGFDTVIEKLHRADETIKHLDGSVELIADNRTLVETASRLVDHPIIIRDQIETSVEDAAAMLARRAAMLQPGEVLVAGGEATVARRGSGRGGRCCELAVRFAMQSRNPALFGTSDGLDGSSGVAAVVLNGAPAPPAARDRIQKLLENSDSLAAAELVGRTIRIPPVGNNLRDLILVSADNGTMAHH